MRQISGKEALLWSGCMILTILTGTINSVWTVYLLKEIVEVVLQNGGRAPGLLFLFAVSVAAGAMLEILRLKLRYILYREKTVRLEDRLISACCRHKSGGKEAFVLIQNTVDDFVSQHTDWVLECGSILGVSAVLGIYTGFISVTALLICLGITGISLCLMWRSNRKIPEAAERFQEKMNAVYGEMWNYLRCKEILPFLQPQVYEKYEKRLEENQQSQILLGRYTNTARICMRFGSIGITLVAIALFGTLTIKGRFALSEMLAITMLLPSLAESMLRLPNCIAQHKKLAGMERKIAAFLESVRSEEHGNREPLKERIVSVQAHNMEYGYKEGEVNCRVDSILAQSGKTIGIFGESGAGKTTLLRILMGELQSAAGECLVNGHKVESLEQQELWSHILYLPQEPVILPTDIRGNITMVEEGCEIDDSRYREALRKAGIGELAAAKEGNELDGSALSSGEIQKICLARCFYTEKEVLILDEATSAMSPAAQKAVLENLIREAAQRNKILILVSHNPAVIDLCDSAVRIQQSKTGSAER